VLDGAAELAPGVRVIATPGHTPGHQSVLVSAGDEELLITGDLLVHAVQLRRPEVAYAYDMDAEVARATRRGALAARRPLAVSHLGVPFLDPGQA
jgi:glyoxylase-like metal-dependent hydrolase (beta-lactamase superfamily II)